MSHQDGQALLGVNGVCAFGAFYTEVKINTQLRLVDLLKGQNLVISCQSLKQEWT